MSHFQFEILAFSNNFWSIEIDLSGNTFLLKLQFQKWDFFFEFKTPCIEKSKIYKKILSSLKSITNTSYP